MVISTKAAGKFAENCVPQSLNLFTFQFPHHASADATPVVALRMHKSIFSVTNAGKTRRGKKTRGAFSPRFFFPRQFFPRAPVLFERDMISL